MGATYFGCRTLFAMYSPKYSIHRENPNLRGFRLSQPVLTGGRPEAGGDELVRDPELAVLAMLNVLVLFLVEGDIPRPEVVEVIVQRLRVLVALVQPVDFLEGEGLPSLVILAEHDDVGGGYLRVVLSERRPEVLRGIDVLGLDGIVLAGVVDGFLHVIPFIKNPYKGGLFAQSIENN